MFSTKSPSTISKEHVEEWTRRKHSTKLLPFGLLAVEEGTYHGNQELRRNETSTVTAAWHNELQVPQVAL